MGIFRSRTREVAERGGPDAPFSLPRSAIGVRGVIDRHGFVKYDVLALAGHFDYERIDPFDLQDFDGDICEVPTTGIETGAGLHE